MYASQLSSSLPSAQSCSCKDDVTTVKTQIYYFEKLSTHCVADGSGTVAVEVTGGVAALEETGLATVVSGGATLFILAFRAVGVVVAPPPEWNAHVRALTQELRTVNNNNNSTSGVTSAVEAEE